MATGHDTGNIAKKNISDLVTCPLCLEYYQRPKLLSCGHSVCQECLQVYIDKTSKNGTILCPLCRTSISLPEGGADGLTHSFLIVRLQDEYNTVPVNRPCDPCAEDGHHFTAKRKCVECSEYLCEDCIKAHRKVSFSKKHEIISIGENDVAKDESEKISRVCRIKCIKHHDETMRCFCLPCQMSSTGTSAKQAVPHSSSANVSTPMWKIFRRLETLKEVMTIQSPGGMVTGTALTPSSSFICSGGILFKADIGIGNIPVRIMKGDCYIWAVYVTKTNNIVSIAGQPMRLIVSGISATQDTAIIVPCQSRWPDVVLGRPVDGKSTYFVTEWSTNQAVHQIDCSGKILRTLGKEKLKRLRRIAVDVEGDVMATDYDLDDVIIFDHDGSARRSLRQQNNLSTKRLSGPWGICVDKDGFIFVSSHNTHSVLLFSPAGDYIRTVLTERDGISYPTVLAVSQNGLLAVAMKYQVKIFAYMDSSSDPPS